MQNSNIFLVRKLESSCSVAKMCLTLRDPMDCSTPGFPVLHYLPEFAQTHVHWVSDTIQPSHPLSPPSPPALNLSQHQGPFQWAGSSHQVAKVLELCISPSNEYLGWISFRNDWFDLLAVQGTLKSLLQICSCRIFPPNPIYEFLWQWKYVHLKIRRKV